MLDKNRQIINNIDKEIIKLLEERYHAASNIAQYKIENNLPVFDPSREHKLFEFYKEINTSKYSVEIEAILEKIILESKNIQTKILNKNK